ncbi:tyrosine-type recombinase/integrase [Streptodolium elevatio]|uniref:Site-specific integrase n=1 Tax=Streptodolium elevatio TaxID=3157996 RepID=A0ABV3DYD7_9ACTN
MAWSEKHGTTWRVRYLKDDGTLGSENGYPDKDTADDRADEINTEQRRGTFTDPALGQTPVREWVDTWRDTLDVGEETRSMYESILRNHLLPRWGEVELAAITRSAVRIWKNTLGTRYAVTTVTHITKLLSMILADAVDEGLITANPAAGRRRGRRSRVKRPAPVWAEPCEVLAVAERIRELAGSNTYVMVLCAAYTGMRWGETTGLRWANIDLVRGVITLHPETGSLHEINGRCFLGPPKTAESAREIAIPPFLAALLETERQHAANGLKTTSPNGTEQAVDGVVFTSPDGGWWRRSTFSRRYWRPAVYGDSRRAWAPLKPGLTFHGLRHSHNTWMIDDGIIDVARARRLGHHVPDKLQDVYGHVSDRLVRRIVKNMEKRWQRTWDQAHPETPAIGSASRAKSSADATKAGKTKGKKKDKATRKKDRLPETAAGRPLGPASRGHLRSTGYDAA